ncbi:MAG: hypothetical protein ABSA11_11340 [Candidatus Bathyarchaeia archaeon]
MKAETIGVRIGGSDEKGDRRYIFTLELELEPTECDSLFLNAEEGSGEYIEFGNKLTKEVFRAWRQFELLNSIFDKDDEA